MTRRSDLEPSKATMTEAQELQLRSDVASVIAQLALHAQVPKRMTPVKCKELANKLEMARRSAGWEPLRIWDQKP